MAQKAIDKLAPVTSVSERPDIGFTLSDVILVNEQDTALNWPLTQALTSAQVGLAMSQASTVTLQFEDADYAFLNDPVFKNWAFSIQDISVSSARNYATHRITAATSNINAGIEADMEWVLGQRPIDLFLDTIAFRLCAIQTQRTILTLTFEDRVASLLRDKKGFKTAERGRVTRAQFVQSLCKEAGVEYFIPELDIVQPVAKDAQASSAKLSSSGGVGIGLTTNMGIKIKGAAATAAQIAILNTALQAAASVSAPYIAAVALIEALITENTVANPGDGNPADEGVLSITASTASGLPFDPNDVAASCNWFLTHGFYGQGGAIAIASSNPSMPSYLVAQATQGSAFSDGSNYMAWESEAQNIVNLYKGGGGPSSAQPPTVPGPYAFTRGPNEDSWDCIERLASEVGWYAFARENRLWFVSGDYLFTQATQLSVARGENGIDYVDVNLDTNARDQIAEVTVSGRTHLWTALPGMMVQVNNRGPATGKWVTDDVQLDLLDESNAMTSTLHKPMPARPEPASTPTTPTKSGSSAFSVGGYRSPFTKKYVAGPANVDDGVDFGMQQGIRPGDLIVAPGDCYLRHITWDWYSGQPCMFFEFVDKSVGYWGWYVGEEINPVYTALDVLIKAGTTVATFAASGTGIEIGFAGSATQTARQANGLPFYHDSRNKDGSAFLSFLDKVGAIAGVAGSAVSSGVSSVPGSGNAFNW